ncbi:MAG: GyrI-like domain-containing protein [Bacteroidetes bacterium]|nr:GyrI-like domain-containing protein [Bacteroidota bacterium]
MQPQIKVLSTKKLIGKCMIMSLSDNKTGQLWKSFMQHRKHINNVIGAELYSLQEYDVSYFRQFNPANTFVKWAAVEVTDFDSVPGDMETYTLAGGLYAVFHYTGSSLDRSIFQYIFSSWLPNSDYELDNRPHFELLGANYKNADPDSEEDIFIPVKLKASR